MRMDRSIYSAKVDPRSTEFAGNIAIKEHGKWLKGFPWKYWVNLTFSNDRSAMSADALLDEFIDRLGFLHRATMSCLIAQERKTLSGCGKPAGRVHFHILLGTEANITAASISDLWTSPHLGGYRTRGAGAYVVPYDPAKDATNYCFKFTNDPAWDWRERNLDLLSPIPSESSKSCARTKRKLRRRAEREQLASISQPMTFKRSTLRQGLDEGEHKASSINEMRWQ